MIDYFPKGKSIYGKYYNNLLDQLKQKKYSKETGYDEEKVIFHHDDASAHSS